MRTRVGQTVRRPWVTLVVFVITAAVTTLQLTVAPGLPRDLERTPAGMHGDWWRTITSLFVQDGGVQGAVSNLFFLVVLGVIAERVVPRGRWLVAYIGAGLVGEFAGYAWQPIGGGNSVANCGLAGLVAVAILWRDCRMPVIAAPILLVWCGVLLATWSFPLLLVGVVAAVIATPVSRSGRRGFGVVVFVAATATAVALIAVRNIHGAAMLTGLLLALALTPKHHA